MCLKQAYADMGEQSDLVYHIPSALNTSAEKKNLLNENLFSCNT